MANLFTGIPAALPQELVEILLETPAFRLERIVSRGHRSPPGEWYDEPAAEWVVLLSGSAAVRFGDEAEPRVLRPGDWLAIAAHRRHRVEWTDATEPTVWLALHHGGAPAKRPG